MITHEAEMNGGRIATTKVVDLPEHGRAIAVRLGDNIAFHTGPNGARKIIGLLNAALDEMDRSA